MGRPITINYGSGDTDQFVYSATTGIESNYTLQQGTNTVKDVLTWFPTGQLSKQVFTDTVTPANAQACKTLTYDALDRVVEEGSTLQILYGPTGKLGVQSGQTNTRTYLGLPKWQFGDRRN